MKLPRPFFQPLAIGAPAPLRELPVKLERMIHFVPPHIEKVTAKVPELVRQVDVVLGNLEDAIPADAKEAARKGFIAMAKATDFGATGLWTRINSLNSPWVLDDITEIDAMDYLKIDVQGSELAIFQGGRRRLADAGIIQTEVSFLPLYKKQPVFGEIDLELRSQGFIPHSLVSIDRRMIWPLVGATPFAAINQLVEADAVYVRDFTKADDIGTEQLKHLALAAHHCYGSHDLAAICVQHLINRKAVAPEAGSKYLDLVRATRAGAEIRGVMQPSM